MGVRARLQDYEDTLGAERSGCPLHVLVKRPASRGDLLGGFQDSAPLLLLGHASSGAIGPLHSLVKRHEEGQSHCLAVALLRAPNAGDPLLEGISKEP